MVEGNYPRGDLLHRHRSALGAVERSKLPKRLGEPMAKFQHLTTKHGMSGSFPAWWDDVAVGLAGVEASEERKRRSWARLHKKKASFRRFGAASF